MKFSIFILAFLTINLLALPGFSQDRDTTFKNRNGIEILPQKGDIGIQFDASPALNYIGNMFSAANAPVVNSPFSSGVIVGKYFTSATEAYRFKFGFNISRVANDTFIPYGENQDYIISRINSVNNLLLGFGKEWRRGYKRLQGVYGVEGLVQIGSNTPYLSKEYNLTIKEAVDTGVEASGVARDLGVTRAVGFGFGLRGFVGIEYFVAPRISLAAEMGWGIGYQFERFETSAESYLTEARTIVSPGNTVSGFVINNDTGGTIFGGSTTLSLAFYF